MWSESPRRRALPLIEELEPRVLFSAGLDVVLIDSSLQDADLLLEASTAAEAVVFYDSSRESASDLLARVRETAEERGEPIESLSILSHGGPGEFQLGTDTISLESLDLSASTWTQLADSIAEDGNIYLFGCNVGEGPGEQLLDRLAELTGRDVFASDDTTGAGGDWTLEVTSSRIETEMWTRIDVPLDVDLLAQYPGILANSAPVVADQSFAVAEDASIGTVVGTVVATDADSATWYSTSWSSRKEIAIDSGAFASDETDFPLLVSLGADAELAAGARADGHDILFTAADGTTQLDHEIETFVSATGELQAWVRIPLVSSSADTTIYMYYGNAGATDQQNATGVWDTDYLAVWHLGEDVVDEGTALGVHVDSTSNSHDADQLGNVEVSGKIGMGQSLDGNDAMRVSGLLGTPGDVTLSAWVDLQGPDSAGSEVISLGDAVFIRLDDPGFGGAGGAYAAAPSPWQTTAYSTFYDMTGWHYVVYTIDDAADQQKLYIDGVERSATTWTASINYAGQGSDTYLGRHGNSMGNMDFTGTLDEIRVSQRARSASWIAAEYQNQSSPGGAISVVSASSQLSYTITGGNTGGAFAIDAATGQLTVAGALDSETTPSYALTVEVSDGSLSDTATVTVNATDVNEFAPVMLDQTMTVSENADNGTGIGVVVASDADAGQSLSFQILSGNTAGAFGIEAATGRIYVADASQLDAGTLPQYTLTLRVDDDRAPTMSDTASITIDVTPNNAPVIADQAFAVDENSPAATVVGTVVASDLDGTPGTWVDTAWAYRKQLTIDQNRVYGDLTDFPVLVSFASDANLAANVSDPGGLDIFFALADGTRLDHEIELFNSATGQLAAWVRIPFLSSNTDTQVYLYYGNASAPDQQNVTGVWDADYAGVWHLNEGDSTAPGFYKDSTANGHDGTLSGSVDTYASAGKIGNALFFDGEGEVIDVASSSNLNLSSGTMEVWVWADQEQNDTPLLEFYRNSNNYGRLFFDDVGHEISFEGVVGGSTVTSITTSSELNTSSWNHVSVTWDSTGATLRVNYDQDIGAETGNETLNFSGNASARFSTTESGIHEYVGRMDEVRFSSVARSDAWLETQYDNQRNASSFLSKGTEEVPPMLSYSITAGNTGSAFAIDPITGELTVAGALDHEALALYNLTVEVSDGEIASTATVAISIGDVNEFDPVVSDASFAVLESAANGTAVGTVAAADADTSQTLSYAITGGDPTGIFAIDAATGAITVADGAQLDHEAVAQHVLTVRVTDDLAPLRSGTGTITIDVGDANEFDPVVTSATFAVLENAANGTAVGTVAAADADTSQTLSYAITGGDPTGIFAIDAATGAITVADGAQLDHEAVAQHVLTVRVTDDLAPLRSGTGTITIDVGDANEFDPVVTSATFAVLENAANGTAVGTVAASDADTSQALSYAITGGDPTGIFAIDAATGAITVADGAQLDHEAVAQHVLTVRVTDDLAPLRSGTGTITIGVGDANEFDPVVTNATFAVLENAANGTAVGTVSASDGDTSQTLSYAITGGDPTGIFAIDAATGAITVADGTQLDYETTTQYSLTITATDDLAPLRSGTGTVTVNVQDANEAAPVASDASFALTENSANGTAVGSVLATDADAGQTLSYAITGGDPTGIFAIDAATGAITVQDGAQLDHETAAQHVLTVRVTDDGTPALSATATITIDVLDANEFDPVVTSSTFAVLENAANGTAVGTVSASDGDTSQTLSYAITGGDPTGIFAIDAATGAITVADGTQLDYETTTQYSLTITATDDLAPLRSGTGTVTVNVQDANEAAPVASDASFALTENSANGTAVGSVLATDADAGQTLSYAITGGDPTGIFAIDAATGAITVQDGAQLDHETAAQHVLTVRVTDDGTPALSATATITIDVLDANEFDPVVTSSTFTVLESATNGTAVGTVAASDADTSQTLSYAITGGDPTGIFTIDAATGAITVDNSAQLDHETTSQHVLTVTVTDDLAPLRSGAGTITINVQDVNEFDPIVNDASFAVLETSPSGTAVGSVLASDADSSQTLSYAITGGDPSGIFAIDAATGAITVANSAQLDHETASQHVLTVTVTDDLAPLRSGAGTITVNVQDVNEFDPIVSDASFAVLENSPSGTAVGSVLASDADSSQTLSYAITAGDPTGIFAIDAATGAITVASPTLLDHEAAPQHVLTVTVTDDLAPLRSGAGTITVNVQDVNEFDPAVADATFAVLENSAAGTAVGGVLASDADSSQTLSYAITGGDPSGIFAIDAATGAITVADPAQLDHEAIPQCLLTVTVTDDLAPLRSGTGTITVNVQDVNEFDPAVGASSWVIEEGAGRNSPVGTVSASDADTSQTLTYAITGGNAVGIFAIDPATGRVTVARSGVLDGAAGSVLQLSITVTDDLAPLRSSSAVVTILISESADDGDESGPDGLPVDPPEEARPGGEPTPRPRDTHEDARIAPVGPYPVPEGVRSGASRTDPLTLSPVTQLPEDVGSESAPAPLARELEEPLEFEPRAAPELNQVHRDMDRDVGLAFATVQFSVATMMLSAGALSWLVRSGSLASSLMLSLPAWLRFDPLIVLAASHENEDAARDFEGEWQTWLEGSTLEEVFEPSEDSAEG